MKTTIKSIELTDFRGIRHEKITFQEGENFIEKPNKTGKTTFFDAFSWVIFSKNSEQNSRFTVESNNVENPKTKVTIVIDVDGTEITLSKEPGKWSYNNLEVKKNVFEDFLSHIYNVETLEFLANPLAFMNLHWEVRRNYLTGLFCEKVSENSEFSFLMKSMSISDIRKSKTKQKKDANDGLKKCITIIEVHEKSLAEIVEVDFLSLKKELETKTAELEKLSNFDWNNFYKKETNLTSEKREYARSVAEYKKVELEISIIKNDKLEDHKGCETCGTKLSVEKFDELKKNRVSKLESSLDTIKNKILKLRMSNALLVTEFEALSKTKPDETTTVIIAELRKGISLLSIQISKGNDVFTLKEKIEKEQKALDAFTAEMMAIEGFMDRFATFLVDNYYKSINDNFDGLFFDIENECKCTNILGTEFKDFSLSERINAGVQIVSVLSQKIGLKFPIWIDNRESVSELYPIDAQIINLKVLGA
jgi:hypothetical protein